MTALLAGATGLIGREVARHWTGPGPLHLLVRRDLRAMQPLHRVHVVDFAALPPLPQARATMPSSPPARPSAEAPARAQKGPVGGPFPGFATAGAT